MIVGLYTIKDKLNDYTSPIPFISKEDAIRYFKDQCTGGNPFLTRNKKDFNLEYMGELNTSTGRIVQDEKEITKIIMKGTKINGRESNNL